MEPIELPPPAQLMNFIVGKWISKPIYVAAELGIADMLDEINGQLVSEGRTPDLILMDHDLPDINGIVILR
ncbi:hypothetical protein MHK_002188 [Candidatus Magnetomorum sp. HK-1]|nr:hypothetical protein MHK_002188 [Candidatus Magnetomorum sp. HK-1]